MRPMFLPAPAVPSSYRAVLESGVRRAMRVVASRGARDSAAERRAALVELVAVLQELPARTFTGETSRTQAELAEFFRRHRRRIARIGGLRPSVPVRSAFLPLQLSVVGRARLPVHTTLFAPSSRPERTLAPVYNDAEVECAALMALWVDAWFTKDDRRFRLVESEFVPSCAAVSGILCWSRLPADWGSDRAEILEVLLGDGVPFDDARAAADRL